MENTHDVKSILSQIEPDENLFKKITEDDIPQLQSLLNNAETWMSMRAIFALGTLNNNLAFEIIKGACKDQRSEVRVAVAVVAAILPDPFQQEILEVLLLDEDFGVKQYAINSVPQNDVTALKSQLHHLALHDSNDYIKNIAAEKLSGDKSRS